jgi:hypothetical protein
MCVWWSIIIVNSKCHYDGGAKFLFREYVRADGNHVKSICAALGASMTQKMSNWGMIFSSA